ncbi:MAG TPA: peptidylprolyl isomerase [Acidimicrobiia bacterium]|nr:peptidylprolyl isomerase [Acidimicrobiia bacterium]
MKLEPSTDPPAIVDGRAISEERVAERLRAIRNGPFSSRLPDAGPEDRRARRWVLRSLVAEEIISGEAGSFDPAGVFEAVTAGVAVGREQVRVFYEHNSDLYEHPDRRRIRHHLAATIEDALVARDALARGSRDFPAFDLRRGEFCGPFEEAVFAAEVNEVIGPVSSELGWHVAVVDEVIAGGRIPFEDVRPEIEGYLLFRAREHTFDLWLEQQRRQRATVQPAWGHPGDPSLPDFSHRH